MPNCDRRLRREKRNLAALPFRAVNKRGSADYQAGLQRHHLIPRAITKQAAFGPMLDRLGLQSIGFNDFRANGMLLPCTDDAALRLALPMHRGPHRRYSEMVLERVGRIEREWSRSKSDANARMRLSLRQRALRRRLLDPRGKRLKLNRHDPLGGAVDFSGLDAMADLLFADTQAAVRSVTPAR